MQKKDHIVLNSVDKPLKILFWTPGELLMILGPVAIGTICNYFVLGVLGSFTSSYLIGFFKKKFGKGQLQAVLYWHLPANSKLKTLPPSHVVEYF